MLNKLTLTHKLILLITCLVVAVVGSITGQILMEPANQGCFNSHKMTCEDLIKSGPGENRFIEITSFRVAGFSVRGADTQEAHSYSYMPISPVDEDFETAETIGLVLQIDGALDNESYNQFWRDASKNQTTLDGMCSHQRCYIRSVDKEWPEKLVSAYVINLDDEPCSYAYWMGCFSYAVAIIAAMLGMFCLCWWIIAPKTTLAKMVVACAAFSLGGLIVLGLHYLPDNVMEHIGEAGATTLLAMMAFVGAVFFAVAMLVVTKTLRGGFHVPKNANNSSFDVSNKKLTMSIGKVIHEYLFKDIDCVTYTYSKDQKASKNNPGTYRLDVQSNGQKVTSEGVLGEGKGPIMHEKLAPLVESIVQRHLQQILDGQSVTIAGWTIEGDLLIIPNPRKGQPAFRIPLSSLSKAAYVDGYYQIWVTGVDQAIAKVSEETEGAEILHGVLNYFAGLQYTSANTQATTSQPMQTSGG